MVKCKYALLRRLETTDSAADPQLLENIQTELLLEAERTDVRGLPGYRPMSRTRLAVHIAQITGSLAPLEMGDSAAYESSSEGVVLFNQGLRVDSDEMREMLAVRTVIIDGEAILKVKKPDFLGSSMWEFRFEGHAIEAKIMDSDWLNGFHDDGAGVLPGGALRALVRIEVSYDLENDALPSRYSVLKIFEVLSPTRKTSQGPLPLQ